MMSANLLTTDLRCDLNRLERTNMVTKMEDRIKVDLVALSNLILDNLQLCDSATLPRSEQLSCLAVQFNQGALLQYQYGDIDRAEILCRGAIELFAELSSRPEHRALCLVSMVAPYINLARIYGQKGEVKESLSIFEDIYRFGLQEQDLYIFGHQIRVSDGPAMIAVGEQKFQKLLLSCRVVEAARVLQTVEDYSALLELIEANEGLPEYQDTFFKQYLLELRSRAFLNMGQYDMAMETLEECCRLMPATNTDRIVAHLLLSQIFREWGRDDSAADTLNKLEDHLAAVAQFVRRLPVLRQVAYRLALERHALGDNAKALEPAEKAYEWCRELHDQVGQIKTAILLLRICSAGNFRAAQRRWYEELQQLASTTFFRLERACAYWELGLSAELYEGQSALDYLQNSYNLYRSVPFVDSRQSREAVKRSLDSRMEGLPARRTFTSEIAWKDSPSIDSTFDALMEYVPKSFVTSQPILSVC
jgi:tetratricopeptide (TPR) repeat protein